MVTAPFSDGYQVHDPPLARRLFGNTGSAWLWLVVRVWLGYQWVDAGLHKLGDPAWTGDGSALRGFWKAAVAPAARPTIAYDWYRAFLQALLDAQAYVWFARVIAAGELLVGVGLVLGAFTGVAALFGCLMNFNYMLAGSASTNPVLFLAALGVVAAWKVAGYHGLDRFLLPLFGTPWEHGIWQPHAPHPHLLRSNLPRPHLPHSAAA